MCVYNNPVRKVSPFADERVETSNHSVMETAFVHWSQVPKPMLFLLPITITVLTPIRPVLLVFHEVTLKMIPTCVNHVSLTGSPVGRSSQKIALKDKTNVLAIKLVSSYIALLHS